MSTASAYINKLRVETTAKNNKVEYPGRVAKSIEPLAPACPANPNFGVLNYVNNSIGCNSRKNKGCIQPIPPPPPTFPLVYIIQAPELYPGDPGSGNFTSTSLVLPNYSFKFSNTTTNGDDVSTQLGTIPINSILTLAKTVTPSIFLTASVQSKTNNGTYWDFTVELLSFPVGSISFGDSVTFTYV